MKKIVVLIITALQAATSLVAMQPWHAIARQKKAETFKIQKPTTKLSSIAEPIQQKKERVKTVVFTRHNKQIASIDAHKAALFSDRIRTELQTSIPTNIEQSILSVPLNDFTPEVITALVALMEVAFAQSKSTATETSDIEESRSSFVKTLEYEQAVEKHVQALATTQPSTYLELLFLLDKLIMTNLVHEVIAVLPEFMAINITQNAIDKNLLDAIPVFIQKALLANVAKKHRYKSLASAFSGMVLPASTKKIVYEHDQNKVDGFAISPNGKHFAVSLSDSNGSHMELFNLETQQKLFEYPLSLADDNIVFSWDSKYIGFVDGVTVKVIDVITKKLVYEKAHNGFVRSIVFDQHQNYFAHASEQEGIFIINATTWEPVTQISQSVSAIAFGKNFLAAVILPSSIIIMDKQNWENKNFIGGYFTKTLTNLTITPDNKYLIATISDFHGNSLLQLIETKSWQATKIVDQFPVYSSPSITQDSKLLAYASNYAKNSRANIVNLETRKINHTPYLDGAIEHASLSTDGSYIFLATKNNIIRYSLGITGVAWHQALALAILEELNNRNAIKTLPKDSIIMNIIKNMPTDLQEFIKERYNSGGWFGWVKSLFN